MIERVLDGRIVAEAIKKNLQSRIIKACPPKLAVCIVGEDEASKIYVANKQKSCESVGIKTELKQFEANATHDQIEEWIVRCNENCFINGILVQLPLPAKFSQNFILQMISPLKDVDCFHPENQGWLMTGDPRFYPCTPAGIIEILKYYKVDLDGAKVVIINNTIVVGRPLAMMLTKDHATVTLCNKHTKNIKEVCQRADIIITAVGKADFRLTADMVNDGAVVIDVGIFREEKKIRGDAVFEDIVKKASITPVPGGVGPCTVAMLLSNTVKAWENHEYQAW